MRMFGVAAKALNHALPSELQVFSNASVCSNPAYYDVQTYLDSAADGTFTVDTGAPQSTIGTCVPFQRRVTRWGYPQIATRTKGLDYQWIATYAILPNDFYVIYKDPHVLHVPSSLGGGWLMLLGRYRVPVSLVDAAGGATEDARYGDAVGLAVKGTSFSDIVGFWCADLDFADGVEGPYPLISATNAVADEYQGSKGRASSLAYLAWVGVPAGIFFGEDLFLYYSCTPNVTDTGDGSVGDVPFTEPDDNTLAFAMDDYNRGTGFTTASSRTVFARFTSEEWQARRAAPVPEESTWDSDDAYWLSEERHFVRWWQAVAGGEATHEVTDLAAEVATLSEAATGAAFTGEVWFVDAVPAFCGDLYLFASVQLSPSGDMGAALDESGESGFGIWRARAVFTHTSLASTGGTVSAVYGRDFVARSPEGDAPSIDYIVGSSKAGNREDGYVLSVYKDPDVAWNQAGWWLFAGDDHLLELIKNDDWGCPYDSAWAAAPAALCARGPLADDSPFWARMHGLSTPVGRFLQQPPPRGHWWAAPLEPTDGPAETGHPTGSGYLSSARP